MADNLQNCTVIKVYDEFDDTYTYTFTANDGYYFWINFKPSIMDTESFETLYADISSDQKSATKYNLPNSAQDWDCSATAHTTIEPYPDGREYVESNATHTEETVTNDETFEDEYLVVCTPNADCTYTNIPTCVERNTGDVISSQLDGSSYNFHIPTYGSWLITNDAVFSKCKFDLSNLYGAIVDYNFSFNDNHTATVGVENVNVFLGDRGSGECHIRYSGSDKYIEESDTPYIVFTNDSGVGYTLLLDNPLMGEGDFYHFFTSEEKNMKICSDAVVYVPLHDVVTKYFITQNLMNCVSDCNLDSIDKNSSITIVITPNTEFHFDNTPTATMGNEIIESSQLETGYSFTFNNVDGDIVINATAVADVPLEQNNADYGFINIYNPSLGELQNVASKYFINFTTGNDTTLTEYIIGMFQIFAKPLTLTSRQSVKFGKYDTGVGAKVVREPKVEVDCGSITVDEKYHSALDYDQYVNAKIWLPFCGFFDISSDLFMNNNLYLKYTIDVLTGKCVASLSTGKLDDANTVVYNFCGNAMMKIPYYVNDNEQRSNGAINNGVYNMSEKTPYVIITRQISVTPNSSQLDGKPASEYVRLGDLTGFTKCKEVTVNGMISTKAEKAEIESLLKKGVIL